MNILITTDFFGEYELYRTDDPEALKAYAQAIANGDTEATTDAELIGTHDELTTEEAQQAADEIIYITDYIED